MLSEISQSQKQTNKNCMISLHELPRVVKITETK